MRSSKNLPGSLVPPGGLFNSSGPTLQPMSIGGIPLKSTSTERETVKLLEITLRFIYCRIFVILKKEMWVRIPIKYKYPIHINILVSKRGARQSIRCSTLMK